MAFCGTQKLCLTVLVLAPRRVEFEGDNRTVIIKISIKPAASSSFNERTGIMGAPSYVEVASVS